MLRGVCRMRVSPSAPYTDCLRRGARNTRDLTVTSPQGLHIVHTARRPEPLRDAAFGAYMNRWAAERQPKGLRVREPRGRGIRRALPCAAATAGEV